jgi:formate dehydrogenase subunit gamma
MHIHRRFWQGLAAAVIALFLAHGAAVAQTKQPTTVNPTAEAVSEQQLLRELDRVSGRVSIPDRQSATLIQPEGRNWREFHEKTVPTIGAYSLLGILGVLVLFAMVRGKIRLSRGMSGIKVLRFNGFERFVHWLTAVSFIILALTGLNIVFGKSLLLPLIGPEAFTTVTQYGKYAHNYLSVPFTLGIVLMLLIWIRDNVPNRTDVTWFAQGGGLIGSAHPPAKRFNGGQKVIFWSVVLIGGAIAVSGLLMMFPFYNTTIAGMQLATLVHGIGGIVLTAIIIAHIYIGSVGMEGAFDAMGSGEVDLNWAREHHSLWADKAERVGGAGARPSAVPAE